MWHTKPNIIKLPALTNTGENTDAVVINKHERGLFIIWGFYVINQHKSKKIRTVVTNTENESQLLKSKKLKQGIKATILIIFLNPGPKVLLCFWSVDLKDIFAEYEVKYL